MSRSVLLRSLLLATLTIVLAACSTGSSNDRSASGPSEFSVTAVDGGFAVAWNPSSGVGEAPDIEVASTSPLEQGWTEPTGWERVPVNDAADGSLLFDDVVPTHRYRFRIREGDGSWTAPVDRMYVETTLPVLRIDTDDPHPVFTQDTRDVYYDASFRHDPFDGDGDGFERDMRIRARGNSTLSRVEGKTSYQVDFGEKISLLGMPKAEKWVLLANFLDPTQLRNWIAMQISRATDLAWTPESDWVELYFNGDYAGIYQVFEKVDVGPGKVDIDEVSPGVIDGDAITGGYLLQIEFADKPDKNNWRTPQGIRVAVQRPKAKNSNDAQFAYIRDHVNDFEEALFSEDFTNPQTGYRRYLDVDSFIDLWIVQELTANTDAYTDSLYFYKKRDDEKLYFGPAWDFDTSLGTRFLMFADLETPWYTALGPREVKPGERAYDERPWVLRLFQDPWFREQVARRWWAAEPAITTIPGDVLALSPRLDEARTNDLVRWKDSHDTVLSRHRYGDEDAADRSEFVVEWLENRIRWISDNVDTAVPTLPD